MTVSERQSASGPDGDRGPASPQAHGEDVTGTDDAEDREAADATGETAGARTRETDRWHGIGALSLLAIGAGALIGSAGVLLASTVGLAFAGYGALTASPDPDLAVERTVEEAVPDPGETVAVTVTITNEGDDLLPDCRLVDGVPPGLTVVEGSPRTGAVLRPGASTTFSYTVEAERGSHRFEGLRAVVRDVSGASETVATVGGETDLTCVPQFPADPPPFPLRRQTSQYTGSFPGDTGGPGIEFFSTREYRTGDPLSRVDWRRTARTGELTTVEFRVERTVQVVLVVDARALAYTAGSEERETALERSLTGAATAYAALTGAGHEVGLAAIAQGECWLAPGSGSDHRLRARHVLATDPAFSASPPERETDVFASTERLKGHLPADAQVVLCTPLLDDLMLDAVTRLDAHGWAATVISPDPTGSGSAGQDLERARRRVRIADLRSKGVPVVDWRADEDVDHAVARTKRRWSK